MVIAEYLRACGYKVIESGTSEDALRVLRSDAKLDSVFAEVAGLGSTDGFALAKLIRESHSHIDVILTSGAAAAAGKAGQLCEEGVLGKPYHPEEVLRRIRALQERRKSCGLRDR